MPGLKLTITILCALGLYASVFMLRKSFAARAGHLQEPSVVDRPAATLLFGVPNAALGLGYYVLLGGGVWVARGAGWVLLAVAAAAAAAMSLRLAYSLLFITRMPCVYCWTSHAINWLLVLLLLAVFKFT